jgi:hypothetical protein
VSCSIIEGAFFVSCDARCMWGVGVGDCNGDGDECISLNDDGMDCTCLDRDVRRGEKKGRGGPIICRELGAEIGVRRC